MQQLTGTDEPTVRSRGERDLLDVLTHELGNQLTVINGFAEMLADGIGELPPDMLREFSLAILRNGEDMRALLQSVADFRRLESHALAVRAQEVDLVPLVRRVVDRWRADLGARRIDLVLPDMLTTAGDRDRLGQIVARLLSNVARYTPGDATVTVRLAVLDEHVELSVADDGPGLPAAVSARVLRRPSSAGMGMGLYLSREVARAHGGDLLLVDRAPGCGVVLRLPSLPG